MEVLVRTGDIRCAKLQSDRHHQQTNTQSFTGCMAFQSPNQQCQSTEGKSTVYATNKHNKIFIYYDNDHHVSIGDETMLFFLHQFKILLWNTGRKIYLLQLVVPLVHESQNSVVAMP